jgi:DNA-binding IscR family transcriptional regulator
MILSRTSQYAIQALIYIATRPPGEPILNRKVAEYLGVPTAYLAKIMQSLCRGNLL